MGRNAFVLLTGIPADKTEYDENRRIDRRTDEQTGEKASEMNG